MARFDRGWVKIYRSLADEDFAQASPFLLGVFVKLLLWAYYKPGKVLFAGKPQELAPGQLITGLRDLSPDLEEDPYLHRVRTALRYLETRGTITQATSNQGRLITICNWDEYQRGDDEESKQGASEAQTDRKQTASRPQLSKEGKKGRSNTKSEPESRRAGSRQRQYTPLFEEIWSSYGRRGDKGEAWDVFKRLSLSPDDIARLKSAVRAYVSANPDKQFRKHLCRFLRGDWGAHLELDFSPASGLVIPSTTEDV
jgi:hypothetical protein